jgi:hypothetical protein
MSLIIGIEERFSKRVNFLFAYPDYETLQKSGRSSTVHVQTSTNDLSKRIINLRPGYAPVVSR